MVVEKERVSLLGVGELVVTPSAGAATALVIAEREHIRTARSRWLEVAALTPNERDDSEGGYHRALRADRITPASTSSSWLSESLSPHDARRRARLLETRWSGRRDTFARAHWPPISSRGHRPHGPSCSKPTSA